MPPFVRHLFVCENRRPEGHPKGCCAEKGSVELRQAFKTAIGESGLAGSVRANSAGCLDACEHGASVVVYPEAVWYGHVTIADVPEIVQSHLIEGRPVERLRIHFGEGAPEPEP
jgi:(2Fe-2S) ferredoxin